MANEQFYTHNEYSKNNPNNLSASEEDYLEMIYRLCLDSGYTRVTDISTALNVKPPSVSSMIKRLMEKNLVSHKEYRLITLTNKGQKIGEKLLRRHNIVEDFFNLLGIENNFLEQIEIVEHALTEESFSSIKVLVDFFKTNPNILSKYNKFKDNSTQK